MPYCLAQGPAHRRCSVQPGDSLGKNLPGQPRPQLSLCVCIALRLPGCCGQEQTLVAQSPLSAHAPQAMLLCTLFLHQAPGRQRACPDSGGVEADAEGGLPTLSQLENKHCFCGRRSGACAAPSLSAWRERDSLPNKSRETFPKHTGPGGAPRPTCSSCSRAGAPKAGPSPSQGMLGPGLCSAT